VAVKTTGLSAHGGAVPALLLPAVDKLKIPASLVIPRNLFKAGRRLEVTATDGKSWGAEMGISVERGLDYERISFTAVED
jgi:cyclic-di-GMP-binding protein